MTNNAELLLPDIDDLDFQDSRITTVLTQELVDSLADPSIRSVSEPITTLICPRWFTVESNPFQNPYGNITIEYDLYHDLGSGIKIFTDDSLTFFKKDEGKFSASNYNNLRGDFAPNSEEGIDFLRMVYNGSKILTEFKKLEAGLPELSGKLTTDAFSYITDLLILIRQSGKIRKLLPNNPMRNKDIYGMINYGLGSILQEIG